MHTRRATQADASAIADIAVLCFWEDELYDFTHPYKKQYPADFRNAFLRMQAIRFNSPGWAVHVAVTDQDDGGSASPGQVVGYSSWIRRGTSEEAKRWQQDTYGMSTYTPKYTPHSRIGIVERKTNESTLDFRA